MPDEDYHTFASEAHYHNQPPHSPSNADLLTGRLKSLRTAMEATPGWTASPPASPLATLPNAFRGGSPSKAALKKHYAPVVGGVETPTKADELLKRISELRESIQSTGLQEGSRELPPPPSPPPGRIPSPAIKNSATGAGGILPDVGGSTDPQQHRAEDVVARLQLMRAMLNNAAQQVDMPPFNESPMAAQHHHHQDTQQGSQGGVHPGKSWQERLQAAEEAAAEVDERHLSSSPRPGPGPSNPGQCIQGEQGERHHLPSPGIARRARTAWEETEVSCPCIQPVLLSMDHAASS